MKKILSLFSLLFVAALAAFGQAVVLLPTTLSLAVTTAKAKTIVVVSATNFVAGNLAYADREAMFIESVSGTTITVQRGAAGTFASPHAASAPVWVGTPNQFYAYVPQGMCTRANLLTTPWIDVKSGVISDCLGGQWTPADIPGGARVSNRFRVYSPEPGGTAYTALNTSGTTLGATTLYCTEVFLPTSKLLTGIAILNGTTVGTDNHYVALYDNGGTALASSALAGAVSATASAYQSYAFTSKFFAVGPADYFACFQTNGTTDTIRMAVTGTNDNILTKGQTGATFGTLPALTVPTTFTTAVGPYLFLY